MMNFGPIKLLFTAVAALLILGPKRLPAAVRSVARALGALTGLKACPLLETLLRPDALQRPCHRTPPRKRAVRCPR